MKAWKVLGLAGLAGVAASGVVIRRAERRRQALSPDEVRARLHARHAAALPSDAGADAAPVAAQTAAARWWERLRAWSARHG